MTQLHDLTALEQAAAVRAGKTSSGELVEHYAARIEKHDGDVGAFVTLTFDQARQQAAEADRAVAAGEELPPLHGVPIAIKDLNMTDGVPTKLGSKAFEDFVPPFSDFVVDKLRAAGTISLGKTNTPEFGLPCYSETEVAPPARTPWDLSRSAGGSSGGAGAAVAAGFLPFAQGSDGGGSVRIPASVCGLFGIKVSRGRISRGPLQGDITGLSWDGPLARTVRDAAALLDAMAGPMPGDPHWAPPPSQSFLSYAEQAPGRLRIARSREPSVPGAEVHPHVVEAYDAVSELLESLGHEVVDIPPPYDAAQLLAPFKVLWGTSASGVPVPPEREELLLPLTRYLRDLGNSASANDFTSAMATLQAATRNGIAATAQYDVLLTPTVALPPVPIGYFSEGGDPAEEFDRMTRFTPWTAVFNMTGQPAASVPLHWSPDGLPIGVMLVGRPADEGTLISLSAQLEEARPWRQRHPAMW
ncbi:MAG: amidase [Actinobacteria bacterium]|nr:amidase [Actinomycetota bacterium]MCA1721408.1 amidase [Actinomycetota bacterium]